MGRGSCMVFHRSSELLHQQTNTAMQTKNNRVIWPITTWIQMSSTVMGLVFYGVKVTMLAKLLVHLSDRVVAVWTNYTF